MSINILGVIRVGQFKEETHYLHGVGIQVNWLGDIWEGYWEDGKLYGQGKYITENFYYIGEFVAGGFDGEGTICFREGVKFVPDVSDSCFNQKEYFCWVDGKKYVGQFKNGCRYGQGIQYTKDGQIEKQGDWADRDSFWIYK